ncbi:hypothetical protein ACLOJK_034892 [Asimina triloba]
MTNTTPYGVAHQFLVSLLKEVVGSPITTFTFALTLTQPQTTLIDTDFEAIDSDPHPSPSPPPQPHPKPPLLLPSQSTPSQPRRVKQMAHRPKCTFIRLSPELAQLTPPPNPPSQATPPTIFTSKATTQGSRQLYAQKWKKTFTP